MKSVGAAGSASKVVLKLQQNARNSTTMLIRGSKLSQWFLNLAKNALATDKKRTKMSEKLNIFVFGILTSGLCNVACKMPV